MMRDVYSVMATMLALLFASSAFASDLSDSDVSPLPLADMIDRVRQVAPQRRAAYARLDAAHGALLQTSRLPNPSLDLREENLNFNSGRHGAVDQTVDVFAVISQPIETASKRPLRTAIATTDINIAHATIRETERTLTLDTMRLYLAALRASRVVQVLADNRQGLQVLIDTLALERARRFPDFAFTAATSALAVRIPS